MGFEKVKRIGKYWDDVNRLDGIIKIFPFHTTGKNERDFENGFASTLLSNNDKFKAQVITQINQEHKVQSVYCFGQKHRPDMTLDDNGVALELKYFRKDSNPIKTAIGQGLLYRLRYKFVVIVLVVSSDNKKIYFDIHEGKEKDLTDTLQYLADSMNVFTYIVPSFSLANRVGIRKCFSFFHPTNE